MKKANPYVHITLSTLSVFAVSIFNSYAAEDLFALC